MAERYPPPWPWFAETPFYERDADGKPDLSTGDAYSEDISSFEEAGAQVLAISPQSIESHDEFSCKQGGFGFPLLADTDKAVGEAYGILGPLGFYRRSVFVVDRDGIVRYAHKAVAGLTFRSTKELVEAVRAAS